MNTTDYFTNIHAMFLFCIFTCGLIVWAVIWGLNTKNRLNKDLTTVYGKLNLETIDNTERIRKYQELFKQHIERGKRIIALEVAKDNAEKESRDLRKQLDHAEADRVELRAERATLENKLTDALAKVRKSDKDGKFLPSVNARVRTVKKLKLVTDLGENEVIHCKTAKERLVIRKLMHDAGMQWCDGDDYLTNDAGSEYGKDLCFNPKEGSYTYLQIEKNIGSTIHPASDFIARPKRVKKVNDETDALRAFDEMMGNPIEQLQEAFSQIKAESPKLVHGLTVKNPTDDEAKMIYESARDSKVKTWNEDRTDLPHIWYCKSEEGYGISRRVRAYSSEKLRYVTAKEFVQRMQNGRG